MTNVASCVQILFSPSQNWYDLQLQQIQQWLEKRPEFSLHAAQVCVCVCVMDFVVVVAMQLPTSIPIDSYHHFVSNNLGEIVNHLESKIFNNFIMVSTCIDTYTYFNVQ